MTFWSGRPAHFRACTFTGQQEEKTPVNMDASIRSQTNDPPAQGVQKLGVHCHL